jgi:hypothetical protein
VLLVWQPAAGGFNSLMAEMVEGHIRDHLSEGQPSLEGSEDLIEIVRAYPSDFTPADAGRLV